MNVSDGPEALESSDTVLVPAAVEDYEPQEPGRLAEPVRQALERIPVGARVGSICTGSFVLAAAGLLAGRRATTHWKSCDELRTLYPEIDVDPDVLYTDDRGVLSSAGVAAGIDPCLHMIRSDHGADVANTVARRTVVPPHREGGRASAVRTPVHEQEAPGFGTVRLVPVEPAADLYLIHGWVTEERARFRGMGDASREEVLETYEFLDSLTTHHAFLALRDGVPVALLQTYEPGRRPAGRLLRRPARRLRRPPPGRSGRHRRTRLHGRPALGAHRLRPQAAV